MGSKGQGIGGTGGAGGAPMGAAYYPPSADYQSHIEHIKQLGKLTPSLVNFFNGAMFVLD